MRTELQSAVVTVGQRGTIVIPAEIRKEMGLECGSSIMLIVEGDQISLIPVSDDPLERLAWAGRGLFSDDADKFIRELRDEWD